MSALLVGVAVLWFLTGAATALLGLVAGSIFAVPEQAERQLRLFNLGSTAAILLLVAALLTLLVARDAARPDAACQTDRLGNPQ